MIHDFKINLNPSAGDLRKFGILAHISEEDRDRIFQQPAGDFKKTRVYLEKEVAAMKKKGGR